MKTREKMNPYAYTTLADDGFVQLRDYHGKLVFVIEQELQPNVVFKRSFPVSERIVSALYKYVGEGLAKQDLVNSVYRALEEELDG